MLDSLKGSNVTKKIFGPGEFYYEYEGEKIMFRGKHLMYTLRAEDPEAVYKTLMPTKEMKEDFKKHGRLTTTQI